jgi:glutamine synthetase
MMALEGMLTSEALRKMVEGDEVDTVLVMFTDSYGRFMGKRVDYRFFLD